MDLGGKEAKELLSKKRRRRRRVRPSSDSTSDSDAEGPVEKKKKEKKKKEKEIYKSAQFIEDSDEEYGDMDAFLEKEKELRERTAKAAESGTIGTMKATGTKKRRRGKDGKVANKKWKGEPDVQAKVEKGADSEDSDIGVIGELERDAPEDIIETRPRPKPRPRPRLRLKKNASNASSPPRSSIGSVSSDAEVDTTTRNLLLDAEGGDERNYRVPSGTSTKKRGRIIISDDESE